MYSEKDEKYIREALREARAAVSVASTVASMTARLRRCIARTFSSIVPFATSLMARTCRFCPMHPGTPASGSPAM